MPGTKRYPQRPHQCFTWSADRRVYSNGGGLPGLFFGLLFTSTGLFTLGAAVWTILVRLGIATAESEQDQPLTSFLGALAGVLLIGAGHLLGGTLLLFTLRTTLDRAAGTVTVRTGWMGLRRTERRLSDFRDVTLLPMDASGSSGIRSLSACPWFDVVLRAGHDQYLVIGQVSRSPELAHIVGQEIADFVQLPFVA